MGVRGGVCGRDDKAREEKWEVSGRQSEGREAGGLLCDATGTSKQTNISV